MATSKRIIPVTFTAATQTVNKQAEVIVEMSDIKFEVEDQVIQANKACLCLLSPVFRAMLNGNFKERTMQVIPLPGKSLADFKLFIDVTHNAVPINSDNVYAILPIAYEYQCDTILNYCDNFLVQREFSVFALAMCGQYKLEKSLKELVLDAIEMGVKGLKEDKDFDKVPDTVKLKIYEAVLEQQEKDLKGWRDQKLHKEKLIEISKGLQTDCWNHSKLCVLAYSKNGRCTCRYKKCDHKDKPMSHVVLSKDLYNPEKKKKRYFRSVHPAASHCAECAAQTLWHVVECFNN